MKINHEYSQLEIIEREIKEQERIVRLSNVQHIAEVKKLHALYRKRDAL